MLTEEMISERLGMTPKERHSDPKTAEARRIVCDSCENKSTIMGFDQCSECGCLLMFKSLLKFSKCPLGKWERPTDPIAYGERS